MTQADIDNLLPASSTTGGSQIFGSTCDAPSEDHLETGHPVALLPAFAFHSSDVPARPPLGRAASTGFISLRLIRVLLL